MGQNLKHLFKMTDHTNDLPGFIYNKNYDTAAPELRNLMGNTKTPQLIDVVNSFEWTHTTPAGRHEVPYIRMSEYSVEFSALLQNIRYMMTGWSDFAGKMLDASKVTQMSKAAADSLTKMSKGDDGIKKTIATSILKGKQKGEELHEMIQRYATLNGKGMEATPPYLRPYYGLYGTVPTGFEYAFPYFEQQWKEVTPRWAEFKGGGGLVSPIVKEVFNQDGLGKDILETAKLLPGVKGTYIERPYDYTYGNDLPTWTFSFNLLNTRDWTDVVKNFQLCYMLSYQNLPNKVTKTMLDPPVIYEVEVPGIFYSPYAYMSRVSISNKGALRLAKVPLLKEYASATYELLEDNPHGPREMSREEWKKSKESILPEKSLTDNGQIQAAMGAGIVKGGAYIGGSSQEVVIETLIPDAYEVQITVQSLIPESKNLHFHSILGPIARASGIYNVSLVNPDTFVRDKK